MKPKNEGSMNIPLYDLKLFRPMLSAKLPCAEKRVPTEEEVLHDLNRLDWSRGFLASPKIDGVRAVKHPDEGLLSRSLKRIPNKFVQDCLSGTLFDGLDGELISGKLEDMIGFNDSQSAIMSQGGAPFFTWCVFDEVFVPNNAFWWRTKRAEDRVCELLMGINFQGLFDLRYVQHKKVTTPEELLEYEQEQLALGFEGIMFRDPGGRYKSYPSNRSTFKQQGLIKLKRFVDAEAEITGFIELERNTNAPQLDNLGYQKRSAHKANQVAAGTLGKLQCRGINGRFAGATFNVGSGLDDSLRERIWSAQEVFRSQRRS
jgi:DNA ligase-1